MSDYAIELQDVVKRFGAKTAVDHVTFNVPMGSCFGLIGPNGAGKTTTFSMLCGYLYPSQGTLKVLGLDPQTPGVLKRKVGVLPQDAVLPAWEQVGTLLTFLGKLSGLPKAEAEARRCLERVALSETWNVRAGTLSHGMAKRVAMAQALMGDPPIVLLDEPTAGLDPKIAHQVRSLIHDMKGKQTVVVSSHNLNELEELCDQAAILDRGKLIQAGSIASLTSQSEEFRITVAQGAVPTDDLAKLPGVLSVVLEGTNTVVIRFDVKAASAEEMITRALKLLIERGLLVAALTRGRKLEERVMQLT